MSMTVERPYTLIAELTYKCPLSCLYCSNPVAYSSARATLSTKDWLRVLQQASDLGVVQVHFTGGEPLLHRDLAALIRQARSLELYTNLITSGVPLKRERLLQLKQAGLEHVQLSFQASDEHTSKNIAGVTAFEHKRRVAGWIKQMGLALSINVVIHRKNIDALKSIIALAQALDADKLELANVQYLGWALRNRQLLLPTAELNFQQAAAIDLSALTERLHYRIGIHVVQSLRCMAQLCHGM